jgi:hypothetical protein
MLVDIHASRRHLAPKFEVKSFFGQLQYIFVICLPATPQLGLDSEETLILVGVHPCVVDATNSIGMPFYSKMGPFEVVDMACIQCLIGCIQIGKQWAIIDHSGGLLQSYYAAD